MGLPYSAEELFSEDGTIILPHALTFEEMRERWPGVSEVTLAEMLRDKRMYAHLMVGRFMKPTGEVIFKCKPRGRPYEHQDGEYVRYDWTNIVFKLEDVVQMENNNPSFKWSPVVDQPKKVTGPTASPDNWIFCDALAERWGWSPFDVIDVLEKQELPYRRTFGVGVPDIHHLQEAQVHVVDLARWENENAEKIHRGPILTREEEGLRTENVALKSENATLRAQREKESGTLCGLLIDKIDGDLMPRDEALALREELRKVQAENAELRASAGVPGDTAAEQPASPASHTKRTSAATEKANALKLQEWRAVYLPVMIKIAVFCGEDGKKPRCRSDIKAIAKKLGLQLSDAALEDLRSALPDDHKTNKPGAPRQG